MSTLEELLRKEQEDYEAQMQREELERRRLLAEEEARNAKKKKKPKRVRVEPPPVCTPEEEYELLLSIARGDALGQSSPNYVRPDYDPILRHPLPLSEQRCEHEAILRRILSCRKELQAFGSITQRNAWVLEECYMRGAPVNVRDRNGFTPLHIAIQLCQIDCIMVLMNIDGIDVNAESLSGYTPLYIAEACNCPASIKDLLISRGALMRIINIEDPPKSILDGRPSRLGSISVVESSTNLPPNWTGF